MPPNLLLRAALILVGIWAVVFTIAKVTGTRIATPEKVIELMQEGPLTEDLAPGERRERIDRVAKILNGLDFHQRQKLRDTEERKGGEMDVFFESMTDEEKAAFLEQTMEKHFDAVMHAFNEMEAEERKKTIAQIRKDMARDEGGREELERMEDEDREMFEKIVEKGMRSYYQEANADAKMDLAPLLEEMQARIQGMNGHGRGR